MTENFRYPKDHEIRVVWGKLRISLIVFATVIIWPAFLYFNPICSLSTSKLLVVLGLYIDIGGVVIASLKTPYYGLFADGGEIEVKRGKVERKYFQAGMLLIGIGFLLQAFGSLM